MTPGGWIMLVCSWAAILALNVFCLYKLFTEKPAARITEKDGQE